MGLCGVQSAEWGADGDRDYSDGTNCRQENGAKELAVVEYEPGLEEAERS